MTYERAPRSPLPRGRASILGTDGRPRENADGVRSSAFPAAGRFVSVGGSMGEPRLRMAVRRERALIRMQAGEPSDGPGGSVEVAGDGDRASVRRFGDSVPRRDKGMAPSSLPHEQRWRDVLGAGRSLHGPSEIMHLIASRDLWPRERPPGCLRHRSRVGGIARSSFDDRAASRIGGLERRAWTVDRHARPYRSVRRRARCRAR